MTVSATPETVTETARAKINLALHVTARRGDGYHVLDSLVGFATVGDQLSLTPADKITLEITGPFAAVLQAAAGNIARDAAEMMVNTWPAQIRPAAIQLEKNLPVASGIGGGSADAAAVMRSLIRLANFSPDQTQLNHMAMKLGADVPVCLHETCCRMGGIGQHLQPLVSLPAFPAVLINPLISVATPEVFKRLDVKRGKAAMAAMPELPADTSPDGWISWLSACRNDLQPPAIALVPEIDEVLAALDAMPGCRLHRMTGSGATCFGLFEDKAAADDAAARIAADHPDWWVCATIVS